MVITYARINLYTVGVFMYSGKSLYVHNPTAERMGTTRLNLVVDEELEQNFRRAVFEKYGMKKGNIQKAVEEALEEWMKHQKKEK